MFAAISDNISSSQETRPKQPSKLHNNYMLRRITRSKFTESAKDKNWNCSCVLPFVSLINLNTFLLNRQPKWSSAFVAMFVTKDKSERSVSLRSIAVTDSLFWEGVTLGGARGAKEYLWKY